MKSTSVFPAAEGLSSLLPAPPASSGDGGDGDADGGDGDAGDGDAGDGDRRRRLSNTITVNDKDILDNGANKNTQPSRIKLCYGAHVDTAQTVEIIRGMQMFYGTGANEISSGVHGDISLGCRDFSIEKDIHVINIYVDATNNVLGVEMVY